MYNLPNWVLQSVSLKTMSNCSFDNSRSLPVFASANAWLDRFMTEFRDIHLCEVFCGTWSPTNAAEWPQSTQLSKVWSDACLVTAVEFFLQGLMKSFFEKIIVLALFVTRRTAESKWWSLRVAGSVAYRWNWRVESEVGGRRRSPAVGCNNGATQPLLASTEGTPGPQFSAQQLCVACSWRVELLSFYFETAPV